MKRWMLALALLACATTGLEAANTKVTLLLPVTTARPGETFLAGVRLDMNPGWHTYWRNPGSSGMATTIKWQLPDSISAGPIQWPAPERYVPNEPDAEEFTTYVYHDQVTLLVPLTLSSNAPSGSVRLSAKVSWLECATLCLPGSTNVEAVLNIGAQSEPSFEAMDLTEAERQLPKDGSGLEIDASWKGPGDAELRPLEIEWSVPGAISHAEFFPYASEAFEVEFKTETLPMPEGKAALRKQVRKLSEAWPETIPGVLAFETGGHRDAYKVTLTPTYDAKASTAAAAKSRSPAGKPTLGVVLGNLLLALGGGLILNLMPCVLPILSLKVLSLVRHSGSSAGERHKQGIVYTAGVLLSFWVIGGLVIAGRLASWGEQFQDPRFIVAMTVLMTLVALNLFGVFEVTLPGSTVTGASQLASREGAGGAFFNGVLAVVLGASCVAPMLAAAIGWAISQPPVIIFLIFTMIGLGLALPFLVLSFFPALQKLLPKPGPWMEKFKVVMGFPLLATAAWLLSQTTNHYGATGPLWVGLFLVCLALALWIYGEFVQRGSKRKGLAVALALLVAGGGYGWALEGGLDWRHARQYASADVSLGGPAWPEGVSWKPWSAEAVQKARENGRPVLVDFTANWCLTCNTIVKPALEKEPVQAKLKSMNALAMIADYTLKNPTILAELKRFQRAGVPLVVVYPASPSEPPQVVADPNPLLGVSHYANVLLKALDQASQ